jgi:outer membrane lipoprotein-sorting protein
LRRFAGALAVIALTLPAIAIGFPEAKTSLYQESRTTIVKDNQSQTVTRRVWIRHPGHVRMEETVGPQSRITVSNGADLWIALPAVKKGQHRKLTAQQAALFSKQLHVDLDMVPKFVKSGAKKVKQEKVNGVPCDVYQRPANGGLTLTLWVAASGQRLAVKQEESGVVRASDQVGQPMKTHILKSTTDYLKWEVDKPIADSRFIPPAGVKYDEAPAAPAPGAKK